ncbi:hypothetical protein BDF22DRAFT_675001 [Syncephalis plumigaleata]|nr:hypothetical protein BDF22DRAFT_675001 [Syncephalis plumigaleata]
MSNNGGSELLWGYISLNPSGEQSIWAFLMEHGNLEDARTRAHSHYIQALMSVFILITFVRNIYYATILVYYKPDSVASWCCFLQALTGVISNAFNVATGLPGGPSCRVCNWIYAVGITISSICISVCLLLRAYVITSKSKLLLVVGILLMLPLPATVWILWAKGESMITADAGCITVFPSYLPWFRLILDVSINTLFSVIFLQVVIQQYRNIGSRCWKRLQSDGILYLLCVAGSNISCAIIVAFELLGGFSEMMFLVDWAVTSMLLIHQHTGMRKAFLEYEDSSQYQNIRNAVKPFPMTKNSRNQVVSFD